MELWFVEEKDLDNNIIIEYSFKSHKARNKFIDKYNFKFFKLCNYKDVNIFEDNGINDIKIKKENKINKYYVVQMKRYGGAFIALHVFNSKERRDDFYEKCMLKYGYCYHYQKLNSKEAEKVLSHQETIDDLIKQGVSKGICVIH